MLQLSYPGVYIEELPSGQHTITGVATSITAFLGRALWGPVNEPTTVFSFSDYERLFGGLAYDYPLSYAVQDFFLNGGSQAIIVRLVHQVAVKTDPQPQPAAGSTQPAGTTTTGAASQDIPKPASLAIAPSGGSTPASTAAALKYIAASPGKWANKGAGNYGVTVTATKADDASATELVGEHGRYQRYGLTKADLFNLTVSFTKPDGSTVVEQYLNLTTKGSNTPNRIDRVLLDQSSLVLVDPAVNLSAVPAVTSTTQWQGNDGNDGSPQLDENDYARGQQTLEKVDLFNLMCIPPNSYTNGLPDDIPAAVYASAAVYCAERRAILIVDPPQAWLDKANGGQYDEIDPSTLGIIGPIARNAAVYFPRVKKADPEMQGIARVFSACGIIAGAIASTDLQRGVWKAPAGQDVAVLGIQDLETRLSDKQNGALNQKGINCLRSFPIIGPVVWGARTLRGADQLTDEYKYLPVRRLTLYIEESLYRGTKWAVFEPNDETLWSSLRLNVGVFMADLARQGAFYNYKVVCDRTTTTQYDIDRGIVKVLVAFAPVKPAEFVVLQIQQQAGQQPV